MTKVKVLVSYRDLELKRTVLKGEELEVTDERAKVLLEKNLVDLVETKDTETKIKKTSPKKK